MVENPVATRTYNTTGKGDVTLTIGKPKKHPVADWDCVYSIEYFDKTIISSHGGVDSVQALLLAMRKAEIDLAHLAREFDIEISWLEEGPGEFCLSLG